MNSKTIAVGFDGTIVEHCFPAIGRPVEHALDTLKALQLAGHRIILWTMRSGEHLEAAVQYLEDAGVRLYGVNENPSQKSWSSSPKVYANIYIDDAALGCPVSYFQSMRPCVDWEAVNRWLKIEGAL